jgi:hypothetical protein
VPPEAAPPLASSTTATSQPAGDPGEAKVRAFLDQWARALRSGDFGLYKRLGLPATREDFEERFPKGRDPSVDLTLLEHENPAAGEHRVRVRLVYDAGMADGSGRLQGEERFVLQERFGVLRYAKRWE